MPTALEFFAGIGGFACAWPECDVALALDISLPAQQTYQLNWPHPFRVCEIGSLEAAELAAFKVDVWWMSPPCQPYTRRGKQRDLEDPRAASLIRLLELIEACEPDSIALENVSGFQGSQAHLVLQQTLERLGYCTQSRMLCPTELQWPNRRPRFYLLASKQPLAPWRELPTYSVELAQLLDTRSDKDPTLYLDAAVVARFGAALDQIDASDRHSVVACFGSSYGKSLMQAGSYLITPRGLRRMSPHEVARVLGFPETFRFPEELAPRGCWKLAGNSLSIPCVRYVLSHLHGGPSPLLAGLPVVPSAMRLREGGEAGDKEGNGLR